LRSQHGSEVDGLDGFNHKSRNTPGAGPHLFVEVVGDVGDVDG
jgi:hypothetical protein